VGERKGAGGEQAERGVGRGSLHQKNRKVTARSSQLRDQDSAGWGEMVLLSCFRLPASAKLWGGA